MSHVELRVKPLVHTLSDLWYGDDVPEGVTVADVYELLAEDFVAALEEVTDTELQRDGWPRLLEALIEVDIKR